MNRDRGRKIVRKAILVICVTIMIWGTVSIIHSQLLYERDVYDCSDMSTWQNDVFNFIGISSKPMHGISVNETNPRIFEDNGHAWLKLNIFGCQMYWESVGLYPVSISEYNDRYDIIIEGDIEQPDAIWYPHGDPFT